MNPDILKVIFDGAALLLSIVALVTAGFASRRKGIEARFSSIEARFAQGSERMNDQARRLDRLEQAVEAQPSTNDLHRLELQLAGMAGDLKSVVAGQEATTKLLARLETVVTRHEDHLLEGKR